MKRLPCFSLIPFVPSAMQCPYGGMRTYGACMGMAFVPLAKCAVTQAGVLPLDYDDVSVLP
jgi:hypothetical protein